jgi:hypothetical protein
MALPLPAVQLMKCGRWRRCIACQRLFRAFSSAVTRSRGRMEGRGQASAGKDLILSAREDLHELIWSKPMPELSQDFRS